MSVKHLPCFRGDHFTDLDTAEWVPYFGDFDAVGYYGHGGSVLVCRSCLSEENGTRADWVKALQGEIPPQLTLHPVVGSEFYDGDYPLECGECGGPLLANEHEEGWEMVCREQCGHREVVEVNR